MEQKAKTRALLAAFGCALAYLLAGKALAFLPAPAWDVRALSFVHHCIAAPVVEELVFRGVIQQLAQPLGRWQAAALQAVLFAVQHGTPAGMAWALDGFAQGLSHLPGEERLSGSHCQQWCRCHRTL